MNNGSADVTVNAAALTGLPAGVDATAAAAKGRANAGKTLVLAHGGASEIAMRTIELVGKLRAAKAPGLALHHVPLMAEDHGTIFHPAAMAAFRLVLAPAPAAK